MRLFMMLCGLLLSLLTTPSFASKHHHCSSFSPLTFGILPFVSAEHLVIRFTPLINYLSQHLHTKIYIETAPNFVEFNRRSIEDQRYDILFTAPHFYPPAQKAGYQLIASVDSPGMRAVIVAPKSSEIKSLKDLAGKRLATVEEKSLASLLVRKHLIEHGINPDTDLKMISTPTHDASLLSSYHGVTDASALMQPPYAAASQRVRDSMRIIAKTSRAPHIPISVGKRISPACSSDIAQLLLSMASTAEGQQVLRHNRFSGFKLSRAKEYENFNSSILPQ